MFRRGGLFFVPDDPIERLFLLLLLWLGFIVPLRR